jgi:hypothetical protein
MLFCPGIPGAGKTTLTSAVIDHLSETFCSRPDVGIAYFYFDERSRDRREVDDLVRSVLSQLASARPTLPRCVEALYAQGGRPPLAEVSAALRPVALEYSKVFVVVDALDQCASFETLLEQLFDLHFTVGVSVFATSRPVPYIVRRFAGFPSLEIQARTDDIEQYIRGRMGPMFAEWRKDISDELVAKISSAANGR